MYIRRLLLFASIILIYVQYAIEKNFNMGLGLWKNVNYIKKILLWTIYFISQLGNPLFVMTIGSLFLDVDIENIGIENYYKKIFVPFLVMTESWIVIYHVVWCLCNHMLFYSRDLLFEMLFIRNDANPNKWILLPLIGLGMLLPALKGFYVKAPMNILLGIGIAYLFAAFWVPNLNVIYSIWELNYFYNSQWNQIILLSPVVVYFFAGYTLNNFNVLTKVKTVYLLLCGFVLFCLTLGIQAYSYIKGLEYEITYEFATVLGISMCIWEVVKRHRGNNLIISKIEKRIPTYRNCLNIWFAGFPLVNICGKITNKFENKAWIMYLAAYIVFVMAWQMCGEKIEKCRCWIKFKCLDTKEKINYVLEKTFLVALGIYIFREVYCTSLIDEFPGWSAILYNVKHIALALAALKIYADIIAGEYEKKEILIKSIVTALLFWGTFYSENTDLYTVWIMIMAAKNVDFQKICEVALKILAVACLTVVAVCLLGVTENILMIRSNGVARMCLGFKFPTIIANNFMHFIVVYVYCRREKLDFRDGIILLVVNGVLFWLTNTKSAFLIGIMVLIGAYTLKYKENCIKNNLLLKHLFSLLLPISALGIVVATYMYDGTKQFWMVLNRFVTGRLGLGKEAFNLYGASPWGNQIRWIAIDPRIIQTEPYNYVDSSFVQMIVNFGVVAFAIFVLLGIYTMNKAIHKQDTWCEFLFAIIILHSILDPQYFWLYLNAFLFYSCAKARNAETGGVGR